MTSGNNETNDALIAILFYYMYLEKGYDHDSITSLYRFISYSRSGLLVHVVCVRVSWLLNLVQVLDYDIVETSVMISQLANH